MDVWIATHIMGAYEVIEKLNPSVYQMDLSIGLKHVHKMFPIS